MAISVLVSPNQKSISSNFPSFEDLKKSKMERQQMDIVAVKEALQVIPASVATGIATQTHAIGIIVPPPDIRAIADKTAQFVARNGQYRSNV